MKKQISAVFGLSVEMSFCHLSLTNMNLSHGCFHFWTTEGTKFCNIITGSIY